MNSTFSKGGGEEQSYSGMDLSGKLIIKAQLDDDIRRIPIHNEAITYDELLLMMQRVFRGKLSSSDEIMIKYKDEDNDLITIFDSSDLAFAVQYSRILKLQIFVGGEKSRNRAAMLPSQVNQVRRELQQIRDQVNRLLDSIELRPIEGNSSTIENNATNSAERSTAPTLNHNSREFDPLQEQRKQLNEAQERNAASEIKDDPQQPEAPPVDAARIGTPESTGSGSRSVDSQAQTYQPPAAPMQPQQPQGYQPPPQQQQQQQQQPQQHVEQPSPSPQHHGQQQPQYQVQQPMSRFGIPPAGNFPMPAMYIPSTIAIQGVPQGVTTGMPPQQPGYPTQFQSPYTVQQGYMPNAIPQKPVASGSPQAQGYQPDYSSQQQGAYGGPHHSRFQPGMPTSQTPPVGNPYSKGTPYRQPNQPGYQQ